MSASELVSAYLDELAQIRRQSPHTVSNYRRDLGVLCGQMAELPGQLAFAALGTHHIRRFIAQLHARGLSGRSLARMLSAWRGFYRWLGRRGVVLINPVDAVRAPKSPKALPKVLSPDEAGRLLDASGDAPLDLRDQAMFELFYSSGLRLAELVSLNYRDGGLDLVNGEVIVTGKRGKTRNVPLGIQAKQAILNWLEQRTTLTTAEEAALFVNQRGGRLTARSVERRLALWAQKAGLGMHVHPHMLRHSFASHVLQSSGDLRAVQEMLGHASIASTQVYTHLDFQHLAKVYDSAHPRAKRK